MHTLGTSPDEKGIGEDFSDYIYKNSENRYEAKLPFKEMHPIFSNNFKDYLRYKTITSQNVSSEAQVKKFFYFLENLCSVLKYSSFCIFNHPMI